MIDLVDNIGVLIDESIEIPDIDKEDEFIISIDNDLLNEGLQRQFAEIGIILEVKGGRTEASKEASRKELERNFKQAEDDQQKLDDDAKDEARRAAGQKMIDSAKDRLNADTDTKGNRGRVWTSDDEKEDASEKINQHLKDQGTWNSKESSPGALDAERDDWAQPAGKGLSSAQMARNEKNVKNEQDAQAAREARIAKDKANPTGSGGSNLDNSPDSTESPGFMSAVGAAVKENPLLALGGAVLAAAGAYAVYRYMNSIYRLNKATNYYKKLASSASDPAKKAKYAEKAGMYEKRLEAAKAKARENKKDYIAKTKTMQGQLAEMKKSGGDAKAVAKLEKKLASRNKVLAKIGAL